MHSFITSKVYTKFGQSMPDFQTVYLTHSFALMLYNSLQLQPYNIRNQKNKWACFYEIKA